MPSSHRIERASRDGFEAVRLVSPQLAATFVPGLNMIGCSLEHRGEELLGQRGGLRRYAEAGSSMGIPLLHPWANRLERLPWGESPAVKRDGNDLPIHGLLTASPGWAITGSAADAGFASLGARFAFEGREDLLAAFPFPHELRLEVRLAGPELAVEAVVTATADRPVPVAFGFHPYLRLPDLPREEWRVSLPVGRRAQLDGRGIPTGELEPFESEPGPLGEREYDDLFTDVSGEFLLEGGARRVAVAFEEGYPWAQVYAPADEDFICFEPMTAPTNALVSGGPDLRQVVPGGSFGARFSITVG